MKNAIAMSVLSVTALAWNGSAQAGNNNRIDNRQNVQTQRIAQGASAGSLNAREAQRANAQQNHLNKVESRAREDGKLSPAERAHIEHAQDKQSRHIARQKHNGR